MARIPIPDKTLEKWAKEDLELHKRVIIAYLHQEGIKLRTRNKFFVLYDMYIDESNIYDFFFLPVHIFVTALVLNQLDQVRSYKQTPNPNRVIIKPKKRKRKR